MILDYLNLLKRCYNRFRFFMFFSYLMMLISIIANIIILFERVKISSYELENQAMNADGFISIFFFLLSMLVWLISLMMQLIFTYMNHDKKNRSSMLKILKFDIMMMFIFVFTFIGVFLYV